MKLEVSSSFIVRPVEGVKYLGYHSMGYFIAIVSEALPPSLFTLLVIESGVFLFMSCSYGNHSR